VLLAEQDDPRHHEGQEGRAEGARPAHFCARIVARSDQVDVARAVDLPAAEEEGVDPALGRAIEQLRAAIRKAVVPLRTQDREAQRRPPVALAHRAQEHRAGGRDRRGRADHHMPGPLEKPRDRRDEVFARRDGLHAAAGSRRASI